jgi:hypothetical protein
MGAWWRIECRSRIIFHRLVDLCLASLILGLLSRFHCGKGVEETDSEDQELGGTWMIGIVGSSERTPKNVNDDY